MSTIPVGLTQGIGSDIPVRLQNVQHQPQIVLDDLPEIEEIVLGGDDRVDLKGDAEIPDTPTPQLRQFLTDRGNQVPSDIQFSDGRLTITVGDQTVRTSVNALCGMLAGNPLADSALVRAVLIFEAANNANLPDAAIRSILKGYRDAVNPPQGEDRAPMESREAMQQAFTQIAMASLVESYVANKDGLATDVRRTSNLLDDAHNEAKNIVDKTAIYSVHQSVIEGQQDNLSDALGRFTETFAAARLDGDYSRAFDQLQAFFRVCAGVVDTGHWRQRAADPSAACPPLPPKVGGLQGHRLLDATMETPPPSRELVGQPVIRRSSWTRFRERVKASWVALGNLVTGQKQMPWRRMGGLLGVHQAERLVFKEGSPSAKIAIRGMLVPSGPATLTEAEQIAHAVFGNKAGDILKAAAKQGYLRELTRLLGAARHFADITPEFIKTLMGSKPSAERIERQAKLLEMLHRCGVSRYKDAGELISRFKARPGLDAFAETIDKAALATGRSLTLLALIGQLDAIIASTKKRQSPNQALVSVLSDQLRTYLHLKSPEALTQFTDNIRTKEDLDRLINALQRLPLPPVGANEADLQRWGKETLAMALVNPEQQADAPVRLGKLQRALGDQAKTLSPNQITALLNHLPPMPAFEGLMPLLPDSLPALLKLTEAAKSIGGLTPTRLAALLGPKPDAAKLTAAAELLAITRERGVKEYAQAAHTLTDLLSDPEKTSLALTYNRCLRVMGGGSLEELHRVVNEAITSKKPNQTALQRLMKLSADKLIASKWTSDTYCSDMIADLAKEPAKLTAFLDALTEPGRTGNVRVDFATAAVDPSLRAGARSLFATLLAKSSRLVSELGLDDLSRLAGSGLNREATAWLETMLPHLSQWKMNNQIVGNEKAKQAPTAIAIAIDLAKTLAQQGVPLCSPNQVKQAMCAVRGQVPPDVTVLVSLLDPRQTRVGIPQGQYVPGIPANDFPMPPTKGDLSKTVDLTEKVGQSVSMCAWRKDEATGNKILVKVPTGGDPYSAGHERIGSVLGNQLGLPVNLVQVVPKTDIWSIEELMLRNYLSSTQADPNAEIPPGHLELFAESTDFDQVKYGSVHVSIGEHCQPLKTVMAQMGFDPQMSDYRDVASSAVTAESGPGASSLNRPDASTYMAKLRDGITVKQLSDGRSIPSDQPTPEGVTVLREHTFRIENPELLDQVVAFDKIFGNSDRHGENLQLVPQPSKDGETVYKAFLIDHGRLFHSGKTSGSLESHITGRKENLTAYLKTLELPSNETHRQNVMPMLKQFADLTDEQLLNNPFAGLPDDALQEGAMDEIRALLTAERQVVRDFLYHLDHPELVPPPEVPQLQPLAPQQPQGPNAPSRDTMVKAIEQHLGRHAGSQIRHAESHGELAELYALCKTADAIPDLKVESLYKLLGSKPSGETIRQVTALLKAAAQCGLKQHAQIEPLLKVVTDSPALLNIAQQLLRIEALTQQSVDLQRFASSLDSLKPMLRKEPERAQLLVHQAAQKRLVETLNLQGADIGKTFQRQMTDDQALNRFLDVVEAQPELAPGADSATKARWGRDVCVMALSRDLPGGDLKLKAWQDALGKVGDALTVPEMRALIRRGDDPVLRDAVKKCQPGHPESVKALAQGFRGLNKLDATTLKQLLGPDPSPERVGNVGRLLTIASRCQGFAPEALVDLVNRFGDDPTAIARAEELARIAGATRAPLKLASLQRSLLALSQDMARGKTEEQALLKQAQVLLYEMLPVTGGSGPLLFNAHVTTKETLDTVITRLSQIDPPSPDLDEAGRKAWGQDAFAMALLDDEQRQGAALRIQQFRQVVPVRIFADDLYQLLSQMPAGPDFDRFLRIVPQVWSMFGSDAMALTMDLARGLEKAGVPPFSPERLAQAQKAIRGIRPVPMSTLVMMLDSRKIPVGIPKGEYQPQSKPDIGKPQTFTKMERYVPRAQELGGSISLTQWWDDPATGGRRMVKIPPQGEEFVPATERMISVLGLQLGLPINQVQLARIEDVTLDGMARLEREKKMVGKEDVPEECRYASVHIPVGPSSVPLMQVWQQIGLVADDADYRMHRGEDSTAETGQGPSQYLRSDAMTRLLQLRDGITTVKLPDGRRVPQDHELAKDAVPNSAHTYKISNPEVLDQILAFDILTGNSDRHPGNVLMVPQESDDGTVTSYKVALIDHGRAFYSGSDDGDDYVAGRIERLESYLLSLLVPENRTHALNVLPILRNFADLTKEQLLEKPYEGIPDDAYQKEDRKSAAEVLLAQQAVIRNFLANFVKVNT